MIISESVRPYIKSTLLQREGNHAYDSNVTWKRKMEAASFHALLLLIDY